MRLDLDSLTQKIPTLRIFWASPPQKNATSKSTVRGWNKLGGQREKNCCVFNFRDFFLTGFSTAPVSKAALPVVMEHPNAEQSCPVDSLELHKKDDEKNPGSPATCVRNLWQEWDRLYQSGGRLVAHVPWNRNYRYITYLEVNEFVFFLALSSKNSKWKKTCLSTKLPYMFYSDYTRYILPDIASQAAANLSNLGGFARSQYQRSEATTGWAQKAVISELL